MEFVDWVALLVFGVAWALSVFGVVAAPLWFVVVAALGFGHFVGRAIAWYQQRPRS